MSKEIITTIPTVTLDSSSGLVKDWRKNGWELLEDTTIEENPELELVEFVEEGEVSVDGDEMLERACKIGNLAGQQHAERFLVKQDSIPEEWREFYPVFLGTRWRDDHGEFRVPYFDWGGGKWTLFWCYLNDQWGSLYRLVRCK